MFPPSRFLAEIPTQYIERISKVIRPASSWRSEAARNSWDDEGTPNYDDFNSDHLDEESGSADDLRKGMRVRHPSYGVGIIHLLEGFGDDQKVTILFPNKSLKKFVVKFARLERV